MMPIIWGHIESIVNRRNILPGLVIKTRTPLGTCRIECVVGANAKVAKGFERLSLEDIRPGEFVVATLREHDGWLEAERIDVIVFGIDSAIALGEERIQTTVFPKCPRTRGWRARYSGVVIARGDRYQNHHRRDRWQPNAERQQRSQKRNQRSEKRRRKSNWAGWT